MKESPAQQIRREWVRASLPPRPENGHKGTFGKLLVVGGAVGYTGAPYLCAESAMHAGCGLVFLGVPQGIWQVEAVKCTCTMPFPLPDREGLLCEAAFDRIVEKLAGCDALALGPGLGRGEEITRLVCRLLRETRSPVVLDADGINALAGHMDALAARRDRVTILTPHEGEFLRLGGDLTQGRETAGRIFAETYGCTVVLKGHQTVVASAAGEVLVNPTGHSGLAKGGSGDVLTGVIASLLVQGATPLQAAACGVWLHGCAGDGAEKRRTAYGVTPVDVMETLPEAFASALQV